MAPLAPSDQLLVGRIRAGEPDAWNELIARFEGPAAGVCRGPAGSPHGGRRRRAGDVPGLSQQPAQLRGLATAGKLSVLDRGAQADRSSAARGPPADASHGRRLQRQRMGAARSRPGRLQRDAQRRAARPGRSRAAVGLERTDRSFAQPRRMAEARNASNCCSCAAGPIATWRMQLKMSEQTVANFKFEFLARLRTLVRKQDLSEDVFPELHETSLNGHRFPIAPLCRNR